MRRAALAVLILPFALLLVPSSHAQQSPAQAPAAATASAPVPVPPASGRAMRYYRTGNVLWMIDTLWGLLAPALLLLTGFSARMRDAARGIGRNWFFTVAIYGILFTLVMAALSLPLGYYEDFVRPHAYGLSDQTAAKWWTDQIKGLLVGCVFVALLLWIPYLLLRKSPRRWWLYSGLAAFPLLTLLLFITPIWIEPLFNQFGPMKDKTLESRILALADRAGIEGSRVYEVNKSVDTKTVNAYVTGFLRTKRIVLWDTIHAMLNPRQVQFDLVTEIGHYFLQQ